MASRLAVKYGTRSLAPLRAGAHPQWPMAARRGLADNRRPDATVLPGSRSERAPDDIPAPPILAPTPNARITEKRSPVIPPTEVPLVPPQPEKVADLASSAAKQSLPPRPLSPATPSTPPPAQSIPPRKRSGGFRRMFTSLILLSSLGYAGSVYYALENDNFHDFFTEYVPFGEDAVAYFEERDFQKRFPPRSLTSQSQPQVRGEKKVTIGRSSGVSAQAVADDKTSDLGTKGKHLSALGDNDTAAREAQQQPSDSTPKERSKAVEKAKADAKKASPAKSSNAEKTGKKAPSAALSETVASVPASSGASEPITALIDHLTVPEATEPLVQKAVKMVNDIITVVNSDPGASKYQTTLAQAKSQLTDVITGISQLKNAATKEAEQNIAGAHHDFDAAAKELVSRLEKEMQAQELRWREEYESERERLSRSFQGKLEAELEAVRKVSQQENKTAIVEREIALNRQFAREVENRIEAERNGRLARLEDLSSSVSELQKLSSQANNVVDSISSTQHLHVALDAVRGSLARFERPTPFIDELVALKEVSKDNKVVSAAIASIPVTAYQRGLPSVSHLLDRYRRVAFEVRKAALLPEDAGVASHAASAVLSRFMFSKKSEGMPIGDDVEAVLTRTEGLLEQGNLDGAVREMNGLKGWAGVLSKDWIAECRKVLETRQALDIIESEARLQSVLVN